MITNGYAQFAAAVPLARSPGIHRVGDQIDLGSGLGLDRLFLVIMAVAPITAASSGTIEFALVSDDSEATDTETAAVHVHITRFETGNTPIPNGPLAVVPITVRDREVTYRRFLGVVMTIAGAAINGGAVSAFLTDDRTKWQHNPAEK